MENKLKELVSLIIIDRDKHFDAFYELTKKQVFYTSFAITRNYDASEDIMQDVYLNFLKHINRVNKDKSILGYLLKISKNLSLNYIKKHKRELLFDFDNTKENSKPTPHHELEIVDKIKKIVKPLEFEVLILHVINDMTHKEIAEFLNKPIGTITYTYKCAIDKIRSGIYGN